MNGLVIDFSRTSRPATFEEIEILIETGIKVAKLSNGTLPKTLTDDLRAYFMRKPPILSLAVAIGASAGLRVSEIAGLDWADLVTLEGDTLRVKNTIVYYATKQKKRIIRQFAEPGQRFLLEFIEKYQPVLTEPVFVNTKGAYPNPRTLSSQITRLVDMAGLKSSKGERCLSSHSFRKFSATERFSTADDQVEALGIIQAEMGHSSAAVTRRYIGEEFKAQAALTQKAFKGRETFQPRRNAVQAVTNTPFLNRRITTK
jgi:integrase